MKKHPYAVFLVGVLLVGSADAAHQNGKPKPDRLLTISTEDTTVKARSDMAIGVTVEEKNISRHKINFTSPDPGRYEMTVLLDGHPVPTTDFYQQTFNRKLGPNEPRTWSGGWKWIKPGKSEASVVPLAMYFHLDTPGKYEVTVTLGPMRGPDDVNIKSNTIYITVLPSDDPAIKQK
jgi:hypothetical protein